MAARVGGCLSAGGRYRQSCGCGVVVRNYWAHYGTMGNAESTEEFQYWANQGVWQVRGSTQGPHMMLYSMEMRINGTHTTHRVYMCLIRDGWKVGGGMAHLVMAVCHVCGAGGVQVHVEGGAGAVHQLALLLGVSDSTMPHML